MKITDKVDLNVQRKEFKTLTMKQLDTGRTVSVKLYAGSEPLNVQKSETTKALFRCLKPDGKSCAYDAVIQEDGSILIDISKQTLAVPGKVSADVSILENEEVISTATFFIQVEPIPAGKQEESKNQLLFLEQTVKEAKEATTAATAAADAANSAATKAETAAKHAEEVTAQNTQVFASAIKKQVSGEVISVDDVSEIGHTVNVKVESKNINNPIQLKVVGKNLFDNVVRERDCFYYENGTKAANANFDTYHTNVVPNQTYIRNWNDSKTWGGIITFWDKNGEFISGKNIGSDRLQKFTTPARAWIAKCSYPKESTNQLHQIEIGNVSTEYEEYKGSTYRVFAAETVPNVKSVSPNMTMFSDTEGVTITAEYNVDTQKRVEDLQTQIDELKKAILNASLK